MNRQPVVITKSGKIEGIFNNGFYAFKGIPFAEPPVGKLRWMPPQPVKKWDGTREAKQFAAISPQIVMNIDMPGAPPFDPLPQDEDCLFLNIWTPGLDDAKRPVLFWIHGGAFIIGSGCESHFDQGALLKRGDIVIVSINYRLGVFGFLNLKELTGGKIPATGNEALLDQVLALEWAIENIRSFGGDPDNITISGFSAGGMCIGSLLSMPQATSKFQKAINRSGSGNVVCSMENALKTAESYLDVLGVSAKDTEALRNLTTEQLMKAQNDLQVKMREDEYQSAPFEPVMDGEILPEWPLKALEKGTAKHIPVIAGTSRDELKSSAAMDPAARDMNDAELKKRVESLVPAGLSGKLINIYSKVMKQRGDSIKPLDIWGTISTDYLFRMGTLKLLEHQHNNGAPAYNYLFTHVSPAMGGALGAMHGLDNPFLFGFLDSQFSGNGNEEQSLSEKIQDSTIAFMRNGDPSCDSLGEWPVYGKERNTMVLDKNCRIESDMFKEERGFWDELDLYSSKPL